MNSVVEEAPGATRDASLPVSMLQLVGKAEATWLIRDPPHTFTLTLCRVRGLERKGSNI